jgi:hypothetical protein
MNDREIFENAYKVLKESNNRMTFEEIADILGSDCDYISLQINLNELFKKGYISIIEDDDLEKIYYQIYHQIKWHDKNGVELKDKDIVVHDNGEQETIYVNGNNPNSDDYYIDGMEKSLFPLFQFAYTQQGHKLLLTEFTLEKMVEDKCHHCFGKGVVEDYADDVLGNTKAFSYTCDVCNGDGIVRMTEQHAKETEKYRKYLLEKGKPNYES